MQTFARRNYKFLSKKRTTYRKEFYLCTIKPSIASLYNDLRPDGTGRPALIYDLCLSSCLPLIAKNSADMKGNGA